MSRYSETTKNEIVQHMFRCHLDLIILRILQEEDSWGYKIMKKVEEEHTIKLSHSSLYPLLNSLERRGLLQSRNLKINGRKRRIYNITSKGEKRVEAYREIFQELFGSQVP